MTSNPEHPVLRFLLIGAQQPEISASAILIRHLADELRRREDTAVSMVDVGGIRGSGLTAPFRFLKALWHIARAAREVDVVMLYINRTALAMLGPFIWLFARLSRKTFVVRTLGGKSYLWLKQPARAVSRWVVRHADLFLLQTQSLVEEVKADGLANAAWYPNSRPVPPEQPERREKCRRYVHLGRLYEKKGLRELVDAAGQCTADVHVDVYGPFWYGDFDEELFEDVKRVTYRGEVEPGDVAQVLSDYDAFILPTKDPTEGHPGVLLEAFSVGLPVICTSVGGISEVVNDTCSLIVEPGDAASLAGAMDRLAGDSALYQSLCAGARKRFEAFSAPVWTDRLVAMCRNVQEAGLHQHGSGAKPVRSKSEQVKVSVIIPCRNEAGFIGPCLRSVFAQTYPAESFEVIVADGMSTDGTRDELAALTTEFPSLRIVDNPAGITPVALNRAIEAARGEILVRMDAHAEYAPDYIAECVAVLEETGAEAVGGPWRSRGSGYFGETVALAHNMPFATGGAASHDTEREGYVDSVIFGCWRRDTIQALGGFDEELVRNQDDELHLRIIRSGGKVWQSPRIKSWYTVRSTPLTLLRQQVQYGYWKVRVIRKHKIPASIRHLVPGAFVLMLGLSVLLSWLHPLFAWSAALLAGAYAAANVTASLISCRRARHWRYFPAMMLVLAIYHFGYGYGFLHGMVDMLFRRRCGEAFTGLTRGAAESDTDAEEAVP